MVEPVGAVPFAFGCLGAQRLPGPILVEVLADLGVPPATARTTLARMVRRGALGTERFGRVTRYRLLGATAQRFARLRDGHAHPPWEGAFHTVVYDVAERRRRDRDELRAAAAAAGFGAVRPGLLVGLSDPRPWAAPFADRLGDAALLETGRLECDPGAAARLAERAWDLRAAADAMRTQARRTRDVTAQMRRRPPEVRRAPAVLYDAFGRAAATLAVPELPAELLPADWPEADLRAADVDLAALLYPVMYAYAAEVVGGSPHAPLYVADPHSAAPPGVGRDAGRPRRALSQADPGGSR